MKKGKFNATEVACLKGMLADEIPLEQMGEQLDRSTSSITKETEQIIEEALKDQMYIKKTGKGQGGVVVMTESASSQVDANKDSSPDPKERKPRRADWVHKIYENK